MQVRRLCRGPCFGDPALTSEDADWRNSDDEAPAAWTAPPEDALQPAEHAGNSGRCQAVQTIATMNAGESTAYPACSHAEYTWNRGMWLTRGESAAGRKAMVFSTSANPAAVVASAAAAEKQQRKQRDAAAAAVAAAAAAAAAEQPVDPADPSAGAGSSVGVGDGKGPQRKQDAAPVPEALAGLPPPLGRFMAAQGFAAPTPIQAK